MSQPTDRVGSLNSAFVRQSRVTPRSERRQHTIRLLSYTLHMLSISHPFPPQASTNLVSVKDVEFLLIQFWDKATSFITCMYASCHVTVSVRVGILARATVSNSDVHISYSSAFGSRGSYMTRRIGGVISSVNCTQSCLFVR